MAAIISHIAKSSDFQAEVILEASPYENWYFISREADDGFEYYSAHDDQKHVFFTPANDNIWNWEMWTVEEYTPPSTKHTHPILKSSHGTYIYMDHDSGFIWQTEDPSSCDQDDLITLTITEMPEFEPSTDSDDEEETDPALAKALILNRTRKLEDSEPTKKPKKKTPPPSDSDDESEPEPPKKTKKPKKKTPPPSDSDDESEPEPPKKTKKPKKKTPPPSDSDDESEPEPPKKTKKPKKTSDDKPKRKPNIKLMAFQAYCKDYRPKVKEEHPEAKLGEQQKVLGDWWKDEDEEIHAKYEKIAERKAKESAQ